MDDPFTTAVDVGFDFGTGAGLVNAEEAVGALRVGSCDFANGIRLLAEAGCHVIVDDVWYPTEPVVKDGEIAQAVD
jgi:hypothetical protein